MSHLLFSVQYIVQYRAPEKKKTQREIVSIQGHSNSSPEKGLEYHYKLDNDDLWFVTTQHLNNYLKFKKISDF
jgi:hypothetical protein